MSFIFLIIQTKSHSLGSVRSDLLIHMNLIYLNLIFLFCFHLEESLQHPWRGEKHNHDWVGAGPWHPSPSECLCMCATAFSGAHLWDKRYFLKNYLFSVGGGIKCISGTRLGRPEGTCLSFSPLAHLAHEHLWGSGLQLV